MQSFKSHRTAGTIQSQSALPCSCPRTHPGVLWQSRGFCLQATCLHVHSQPCRIEDRVALGEENLSHLCCPKIALIPIGKLKPWSCKRWCIWFSAFWGLMSATLRMKPLAEAANPSALRAFASSTIFVQGTSVQTGFSACTLRVLGCSGFRV